MKQDLPETLIKWSIAAAPFFIAFPMAVFGAQHFIYLQFVADFIPAWIPWRPFWTCFTGVALIAAAAGIVLGIWDRWAATLLGTMILLWVLLLHTSRIAAKPADSGEWRGIFQALAMSGCAFVLARSVARKKPAAPAPQTGPAGSLTALSEMGARLAPYFISVSTTALGLEHFVFPDVAAPQVPVWIPGTPVGNYLAGSALIVFGVGIWLPRTRRVAAAWLGIMILLSTIFLHLPFVLRNPRFESDWTKTFVLSGGAFLLACVGKKEEQQNVFKWRKARL